MFGCHRRWAISDATRKALWLEDVSSRSEEEIEALRTIVPGEQTTPLIEVSLTGGEKVWLFVALACPDNLCVVTSVVPHCALLSNLVATAEKDRLRRTQIRRANSATQSQSAPTLS